MAKDKVNGWIAQLDLYQDFLVGMQLLKGSDSAWINIATGDDEKVKEIYNKAEV